MRHLIALEADVASESISFQTESLFFKELVLVIGEMKKTDKKTISDSELVTNISKTIEHHTGLDVVINVGDTNAQVNIPMVNKNNVLVNSFIRNHINSSDGLKMVNSSKSLVRGSVSLKTGRVSGVFTEVKSTIDMPSVMFTGSKFEPEEIAAVLLHEVGHLFVYFEFLSRTVTTNQVLAGVSKALDGTGSLEERESILMTAKGVMNLSDLDAQKLAVSNNKKVTEIVLITNITKEAKSELGSNIYDFSTWEYLADQYAARHGAGRHLATGLEKVYKGYWNIGFRSLPAYLAMEALKVLLLLSPLYIGLELGISLIEFDTILFSRDSDNPTYDKPLDRIKRIRDQIVENLKDKKLNDDDVERLTADLAAIDVVLDRANNRRQWIGAVWDLLSPTANKARSQELLQQELEDLAVNELFVKAAELKKAA